ncbi:uncharacterized protein TRAVEDRAFT_119861 [Trametes versicolor FP-101664 SS1]|uniref:uncharacterized protein n=1 Tax=Trametes versicolor (strain FP-101664) TaxID=717944 RepID=UPI0004624214|nr:uncharacterized protein TRAVEDRAFT_119861 [Trametes versicolor FP-101664 SS1]EIW60264.1 hypothetical protein TRAVEDRAFT_119861 [Trametes versicolor FP-101664 SS1]
MTVTKGFTEEADKLLDYMENGIFDAVQKQYLRSFVFAVYLDDQDPNNIVEAYTFNFSYCKVPGSESTVPVMSLGEDMMNLSLSGSKQSQDPVADATRRGKIPTLGETLIKNLIQATTQMDALPKRRFATFKLYYYENTPEDYEPPHFRAGDLKKDKWFMTTHNKGEIPERCSVGSVQTGYHGVDVKVTSVSGYLPSAEDNNAPFLGTTSGNPFGAPPLTPAEEASMRAQQIEVQREDALERRVVWDTDIELADMNVSEGEERRGKGSASRTHGIILTAVPKSNASAVERVVPVGFRDDEGTIVPYTEPETPRRLDRNAEAQYAGRPESVPMSLTPTPRPRDSYRRDNASRAESLLPPSDIEPSLSMGFQTAESLDTQLLKDIITGGATETQEDSMILDMESQREAELPGTEDPIQSFTDAGAQSGVDIVMDRESPVVMDCECGVLLEDCDCLKCDGGCGRWFHLWCMGFHSAQDQRVPSEFICFDCRVKADRNWDLIVVHDLYPRMIAKFRDLAIQRRGIKVFETHVPEGLSAFTKLIGCDSTVAGQVFKRLEAEGFIAQEVREADESGFMETTSLASKKKTKKVNAKTKAAQRRKVLQKPVYVFVQAIKSEQAYQDYFNPDPEVEKRLLGLSDLVGGSCIEETQPLPVGLGSQTQEETQYPGADERINDLKRKTSSADQDGANARKKIKISLGPAVDLGD